jgi:hypothetical protein
MQAKSWPDSFIATISHTLKSTGPHPTPTQGAQWRRVGQHFFP